MDLNINVPEPPDYTAVRIPGLFRFSEPLPLTTRKIGLETGRGKYIWPPSLSDLADINKKIAESYGGYCLVCWPETNTMYILAAKDMETDELLQLLMRGDKTIARELTKLYVKKYKILVSEDYVIGDGDVVTRFKWIDRPDNETKTKGGKND